jgi:hypothetical protein
MPDRTDLDALDATVAGWRSSPLRSPLCGLCDMPYVVAAMIAELRELRAYRERREQKRCEACEHFAIETEPDGTVTESCSYHMQFFCRDGGGNEGYARGWSRNWHCADWRGRDGT